MALWSELPNEICSLIGMKLDVESDRCRFRCVCTSWRHCLPPFPQPPWLMLAETQLDLFQLPENNKSEEEKEKKKVNPPPPLRGFV
ncbi:hypothetical protein FRX31_005009, partial [Thalictrum thalictroides]